MTDMIIGEAWGAEEEQNFKKCGKPCPFSGEAGKELDRWLAFAKIDRSSVFITNVFNCRPPHNDVGFFFAKAADVKSGVIVSSRYPTPYKSHGILRGVFDFELGRLFSELDECKPEKILALGATALWALTGKSSITQHRGVWSVSFGSYVLPTYHPAGVLRKYSSKVFAVHDLLKWSRGYERPADRNVYVADTLFDCSFFASSFIHQDSTIAVDIETEKEITMISFALSGGKALVVDLRRNPECLPFVAWLLHQPHDKVMQNATYDLTWLASYGIKPAGVIHDTMLMAHSLQPELPKDLGTLASLRLNEHAWKPLGRTKKDEQ